MILVTFELFLNIFLAFFAILGYFRPPDYYSFLRSNCSKNKLLQYIHILIAFWTRNSMAILSRSPWPSNLTIHCNRGNLKKAAALLCKNDDFDTNIFLVKIHFRSIPRALSSPNFNFVFLGCLTIHCTRGNLKKASALLCKNDYFDTNIFLVKIHFRSIPRALSSPNFNFVFLGCLTIHCTRGNLKKASALLCKNDYFDTNIFLVKIHFRSIPRALSSPNFNFYLFESNASGGAVRP